MVSMHVDLPCEDKDTRDLHAEPQRVLDDSDVVSSDTVSGSSDVDVVGGL